MLAYHSLYEADWKESCKVERTNAGQTRIRSNNSKMSFQLLSSLFRGAAESSQQLQ